MLKTAKNLALYCNHIKNKPPAMQVRLLTNPRAAELLVYH